MSCFIIIIIIILVTVVLFVPYSAATYGSCIKVTGALLRSDHGGQPVEVRAENIDVVGHCDVEVPQCNCIYLFCACLYLYT